MKEGLLLNFKTHQYLSNRMEDKIGTKTGLIKLKL
jgi:hypothetical protein